MQVPEFVHTVIVPNLILFPINKLVQKLILLDSVLALKTRQFYILPIFYQEKTKVRIWIWVASGSEPGSAVFCHYRLPKLKTLFGPGRSHCSAIVCGIPNKSWAPYGASNVRTDPQYLDRVIMNKYCETVCPILLPRLPKLSGRFRRHWLGNLDNNNEVEPE